MALLDPLSESTLPICCHSDDDAGGLCMAAQVPVLQKKIAQLNGKLVHLDRLWQVRTALAALVSTSSTRGPSMADLARAARAGCLAGQ